MTTVEIGEFRWGFDQKKVGYLMASHDVGYGALKIPKNSWVKIILFEHQPGTACYHKYEYIMYSIYTLQV